MLKFTEKQKQFIRLMKRRKLKRINILEGSVRSGKTWISLIAWALWIASRPKEYLYMMSAKSLQTLNRNCLLPLQELVGKKNFTFSLSKKEGLLFDRKIMLEGANDARSESKIRGITLGGAYCDELTLFPEEFFAMLLSRLSAPDAKLLGTTNPDVPTHWLLTKYLENGDLSDDILRIFFHIDDNTTLSSEYVTALKKEYTGVYYDRFIKGDWVAAQGAIYTVFSNNPTAYEAALPLPHFDRINIGLDFGGSGSQHALVASGITHDYTALYALKSERIPAAGMTPNELYKCAYRFCEDIIDKYGITPTIYADSAEQTLIAGLRVALKRLNIIVKNARKLMINDRIRATAMLMGSGRFFIISEDCLSLTNAFKGAVWDSKEIDKEVRLDDGTSDIDTLDAFEYSFERSIPHLIRNGEIK